MVMPWSRWRDSDTKPQKDAVLCAEICARTREATTLQRALRRWSAESCCTCCAFAWVELVLSPMVDDDVEGTVETLGAWDVVGVMGIDLEDGEAIFKEDSSPAASM